MNLIDRLHEKRAPFTTTVGGKGGVLCHAMQLGAFTVVERLLDLNVELGESPVIHANDCPNELLLRLLERPLNLMKRRSIPLPKLALSMRRFQSPKARKS